MNLDAFAHVMQPECSNKGETAQNDKMHYGNAMIHVTISIFLFKTKYKIAIYRARSSEPI